MSEQEGTIRTEDEDVEAHKKSKVMASDEPRDAETESDDDVELHGRRSQKAL